MSDMTRAMAKFVKWAMSEGPWNGGNLDGIDIQMKAEELGLLVRTAYDPEVHGEDDCAEPGEDWFVLAPEIVKLNEE
jgi:hypothetical protein